MAPKGDAIRYCAREKAENNKPRIDLGDATASINTRFFGYIAKMKEGSSDNTETPFELTVVGRIGFMEPGVTDGPSWRWVKIKTWSPN